MPDADERASIDQTHIEQFEAHRPLMLSIAYRMLGSITDAEDIVQKAYLRYQNINTAEITSHKAFLSTVVTRLCLNHLQLARVQREQYIGTWLPEPVIPIFDEPLHPGHQVELHESLSLAFLVLLEQLTPPERAIFLLREVFDFDYREIAAIVGKEEAACRQMFRRAKKYIAQNRPRFTPAPEAHRQLVEQFVQTVRGGDLERLLVLLSEEVTLWADGGGKVRGAAIHPVTGREAVARFLMASPRLIDDPYSITVTDINGEPAFTLRVRDETRIVMFLTVRAGAVSGLRVIGNPDKLRWINRQTVMDNKEQKSE